MKKITLTLAVILVCIAFSSCKKTYQCTCPAFTAGAWPYVFEVEATSSKSATKKCREEGRNQPAVDKNGLEDCRIYTPVQ